MNKKAYIISTLLLALVFGFLLIRLPQITLAPHLDDFNSGSMLDALYAISLTGLVLFIAAGFGEFIIKPFKLSAWGFLERSILSLPLGLAAIGYIEFLLGLIGWIQPLHQVLLLVLVAGIAFKDSVRFLNECLIATKAFKSTWRAFSAITRIFFVVGCLTILLAFIQALVPSFDYDSLMYHLQGPRLFLEAGRIIPIPENWLTFFPSSWEMIYMLGMGLGSDIFPKLIHFFTFLILILSTYVIAKRFISEKGGWLSSAMLVGMPMMLIWGGFAYIDMAWSLFQILALGLFLIWLQENDRKILALAGIMQGLSLGTKYTAFFGAGILVLFIAWFSWKKNEKKASFSTLVTNLLQFGIPAIIVASPWYLKNLIWTGNPVFPFFFQNETVNSAEMEIWLKGMASFGVGSHWYDFLLLPFTIFLNYKKFSTFKVFGDLPNPSFLLAFCYPFLRKKVDKNREVLDLIFIYTVFQFIIWSMGSQQTRYLMPIFPSLSILSASILIVLLKKTGKIRWGRVLEIGVVGGMIICSMVLLVRLLILTGTTNLLLGSRTKSEFLSATVKDYQAIEFINESLPDDTYVFLPWDGRGYYCDDKCLPDTSQSAWVALVQSDSEIAAVSSWIEEKGITHILLSWEDVIFFVSEHDPEGVHLQAYRFLVDDFAPFCAEVVYEDDWARLYELHLDYNSCK